MEGADRCVADGKRKHAAQTALHGPSDLRLDPCQRGSGAACAQKRRVCFYSAAGMVNDLLTAQDKLAMPRLIQQAQKQELLIIDELGFVPLIESGAQLLFRFWSALHERVPDRHHIQRFAKWTQVFCDETLTAALVDRLTHRGHVIEFVGESFRFEQRMKKVKFAMP